MTRSPILPDSVLKISRRRRTYNRTGIAFRRLVFACCALLAVIVLVELVR